MNVLMTTTTVNSPLDASSGTDAKPAVSDFITIQSVTNFAAMTGAISAGWQALQTLLPWASTLWVPYSLALAWGVVSCLISIEGLKKDKNGQKKLEPGTVFGALFVAFLNSLVLAGAVVGTSIAAKAT